MKNLRLIRTDDLPVSVLRVVDTLKTAGYEAYLVGGCVRDLLLGRTPHDYDVTTNAHPELVTRLFPKVIPTGIRYGTVTVFTDAMPVEVTTYRADGDYSDGRRPDSVTFSASLEEDLARRDFTVNAIAFDVQHGTVDPFCGRRDLEAGIIRAVGVPQERFREDALRMLRAVRLACQLVVTLDVATSEAIAECAPLLGNVSAERIREELNRILLSAPRDVVWGLETLNTSGLLKHFLPELAECYGFDQHNPNHRKNVFDHILAAVGFLPPVLHLRLAGLLHDIAKPRAFVMGDDGVGHFYGHEDVGAEMAEAILRRLTYDRATIDRVVFLVKNHMFPGDMGRKGMRRFVVRAGEHLEDLLTLRQADAAAGKTPADTAYLEDIRRTRIEMEQEGVANPAASLAVNGHDVMQALGLKPGPAVGAVLTALTERIVDEPELNQREALLAVLPTVLKGR